VRTNFVAIANDAIGAYRQQRFGDTVENSFDGSGGISCDICLGRGNDRLSNGRFHFVIMLIDQ